MNILAEIKRRFSPVLSEYADHPAPLLDMIRPVQDARHGDYQANCAMPLGKKLGRPPRDIAAEMIARVDLADFCQPPEIAGPGFINLRISDAFLLESLETARRDSRLGVALIEQPKTYVVDFSSPNVAKSMHVGHIRSTVIGDALCRLLRFLGHRVISDNHLGDWGTQFGMIIYGYKHFRDEAAYSAQPVKELERLYKRVNALLEYHAGKAKLPQLEQALADKEAEHAAAQAAPKSDDKKQAKRDAKHLKDIAKSLADLRKQCEAVQQKIAAVEQDEALRQDAQSHPEIAQAVLNETAKLHAGDAENRQLWDEFLPQCRASIQKIYDLLDISFDYEYGESFYHGRLGQVVQDLEKRGLARQSDGAMCVFLDQFETPMIVRKRDGAYLYATTDLATIAYRLEEWRPDAILYVVDHRQGEHFGKLFAVAAQMGCENVDLQHISFGAVLGEDGRPLKTRSGENVPLDSLIAHAIEAAHAEVCRIDEEAGLLNEEQRKNVSRVVGVAALKYADLVQNRESDYVFSYEKMVALRGNTATYMQYAYARTQSIFARGGIDIESLRNSAAVISINEPAERALAMELLRFSEALEECAADYRPNHLTGYLFELAKQFSVFFEQCHVLKAETEALRDSRLLLCDLTGRTIRQGLELLGIQVVEKM